MQRYIDDTLEAMVKAQEQMARTLQAERTIVAKMARVIKNIETHQLTRAEGELCTAAEFSVAREIGAYLHGLADFEHALTDHVKFTMKELRISEEE